MISFTVSKQVKSRVPHVLLEKSAKAVSGVMKQKKKVEVSVVMVSDVAIRKLNKQYRKKDKVTDILSFGDPDEPTYLGDLIIDQKQLQRQAKEKGHSTEKEFVILFIHGLFHLYGYDHEIEKEAVIMEALEKKALSKVYK